MSGGSDGSKVFRSRELAMPLPVPNFEGADPTSHLDSRIEVALIVGVAGELPLKA